MLKAIRKREKVLLTIFISLISVVFIFWGFYGGFTPLGHQDIASVNGDKITVQEFQTQYQNLVQLYQNILKDKFTPEAAERFNLKHVTLNQLIDQKLIVQGATQLGIQITDKQVRDQIVETPYFKRNNRFDAEYYHALLKANRLTPASYEENVRLELLQQKIVGLLSDHLKISPQEILQDYLLKNEKVNIEFLRIDPNMFKSKVSASTKELEAFKAKQENIEKANAFYKKNAHIFKQEHEIRARHILIKVNEEAPANQKEQARKKIEEIREKTKTSDFSTLAAQFSQDEASAKQGGDLGYFGRGRMIKAFEDAAFRLQAGQISDIVESPYGFHLIKAEDIRSEKHQTFEHAKENIFKTLHLEEKLNDLAKIAAEALWTARSDAVRFKKILKNEKLSWEETGFFSRGTKFIPKIGQASPIMKAAFDLDEKSPWAHQYFDLHHRFFMIRLKKREHADMKKFEKEKDALAKQALNQKRSTAYYEWLKEIKDAAKIKIRKDLLKEEES